MPKSLSKLRYPRLLYCVPRLTTARQTQPRFVRIYVISPHQYWFRPNGAKLRCSKFSAYIPSLLPGLAHDTAQFVLVDIYGTVVKFPQELCAAVDAEVLLKYAADSLHEVCFTLPPFFLVSREVVLFPVFINGIILTSTVKNNLDLKSQSMAANQAFFYDFYACS